MGIGPVTAEIIRNLPLPAEFSVIELGDQIWHPQAGPMGRARDPNWWSKPAVEFYRTLGKVTRYECIDANGNASIFADLNHPLEVWPGEFDIVTDFGTSEHTFNFAQVWTTIHALCKPGGIIAFDKPHQGMPDHGFFNVHLTLLLDIAGANDYDVLHISEYKAKKGTTWKGAYRKTTDKPFTFPVQGKYQEKLKALCR